MTSLSNLGSEDSKSVAIYSPIQSNESSRHSGFQHTGIGLDIDNAAPPDSDDMSRIAKFATTASWIVNWFLFVAKGIIFIASGSKVVASALADSGVDLISQGVLSIAERYIAKESPFYPVGRSRYEAVSVLVCASIMTMVSVEVIQYSVIDLYEGLTGHVRPLELEAYMYWILSIGILLKLGLYVWCAWAQKYNASDTLAALAEDHLNDVFSNIAAIITAAISSETTAWWADPAGAIFISLVIIYRWFAIITEQVRKIVGYTAPPEFVEKVTILASRHDLRIDVDCVRAYYFGSRFNVEIEIVLPGSMTVIESHDLALELQHKIECLVEVERAFVHVDHHKRDGLEHKIERQLAIISGRRHASANSPTSHSEDLPQGNMLAAV